MKGLWYYRPGASTRFPGKTQKEWARNERRRDATYYLWVAIPAKLGLLGALIYLAVAQDGKGAWWFINTLLVPVTLVVVIFITPFIYGFWRTVKAFTIIAIIATVFIGLGTLMTS